MKKWKAFLPLTILLSVLGIGVAHSPFTTAKPVQPPAEVVDCTACGD
jgi:hypothetical protein